MDGDDGGDQRIKRECNVHIATRRGIMFGLRGIKDKILHPSEYYNMNTHSLLLLWHYRSFSRVATTHSSRVRPVYFMRPLS